MLAFSEPKFPNLFCVTLNSGMEYKLLVKRRVETWRRNWSGGLTSGIRILVVKDDVAVVGVEVIIHVFKRVKEKLTQQENTTLFPFPPVW